MDPIYMVVENGQNAVSRDQVPVGLPVILLELLLPYPKYPHEEYQSSQPYLVIVLQ